MSNLIFLLMSSLAFSSEPLNLENWADDFTFDHETFSGNWSSSQTWTGTLCDGDAGYRGVLGGGISKVRFKLEENYIEATADLKDVWGTLIGTYRSSYSACARLNGEIGVSSDWAHLKLHVYLNSDESEGHLKKLEVKESVFGRVHFGIWLPSYLENYITALTNKALEGVWSSWIGDWVNVKISEKLRNRKKKALSPSAIPVPEVRLDGFVVDPEPLN